MPTLSWIFETAEDRFYERGGGGLASAPPTFRCPVCEREFPDPATVSWHVNDAHPVDRPFLLVDGIPAPSASTYVTPLDPSSIVCANTTGIRATCNGLVLKVSADELAGRLAQETKAVFQIELENARAADAAKVTSAYVIVTAVPDDRDLIAVDRLFAQHLAVERPTLTSVREFATATNQYASADRYANGLAEYVVGLLAKEGDPASGATLSPDAFQVKLQRALAALWPHRTRPIPEAVCAVARLNINDVRGRQPTTGDPTLDGTLQLLHNIATDGHAAVDHPQEERGILAAVCPIDRDTHLVLSTFHDLFLRTAGLVTTGRETAARASDSMLGGFDRTKLHVILAAHLLASGEADQAGAHLTALIHDPLFGRWAQAALEGTEP